MTLAPIYGEQDGGSQGHWLGLATGMWWLASSIWLARNLSQPTVGGEETEEEGQMREG